MRKALLIAEKPSLRRKIEEVYNKNRAKIPYEITFSDQRGHLFRLLSPNELDEGLKDWTWDTLPIEPEDYGGFKYSLIKEKKEGRFKTAAERYYDIKEDYEGDSFDFIIHAGDPDQEGELLVDETLRMLHAKKKLPIKRFWSNDITDGKVLEALLNLKDDDKDPMLVNLRKAAYARQHSDWRVGMNMSRAATLKMGTRAALGRVKTPLLGIVCRRESEIENFTPKTVYGVEARYSEGFTGQLFNDKAEDTDEESDAKEEKGIIWFDTREEAEGFISGLSDTVTVKSYKAEKKTAYAPKLYKLATAQIDAGRYGYSSAETLSIIQSLYEAGYMSYPRTDCEYISSHENLSAALESASSVPELAPYVDAVSTAAIGKVLHTAKWINDKKLEESGHSALIPTGKKPDFEKLTPDQQKIYSMIARRFVAIFLRPLTQKAVTLIAEADSDRTGGGTSLFRSTGKTLIDPGYTVIFNTRFTDTEVPEYAEGDEIPVGEYGIPEKTSTCPKRFTDASLIAICENPQKFLKDESLKALGKELKIGTPATRASIISELINRDKYLAVSKDKGKEYLVPTETGRAIINALGDRMICRVDMTGEWEMKLEAIREGKLSVEEFEHDMREGVKAMVEDIKGSDITKAKGVSPKGPVAKCPNCGADMLMGKFGLYCANKCGFYVGSAYGKKLTDKEQLDLVNGKKVLLKGLKSKKTGKTYDMYIKADGIEEFTYSDGRTGYSFKFETSFPERQPSGSKGRKAGYGKRKK